MLESFTYKQLAQIISPDGQAAFVEFLRTARETRGEGWLEAIKIEYPNFNYVFDLVWNNSEDQAIELLKKDFAFLRLGIADKNLREMHRKLRFEIDKPR